MSTKILLPVENSNERDLSSVKWALCSPHSNVHYGSVNQGHGDCVPRALKESFRIQDKRERVCFPFRKLLHHLGWSSQPPSWFWEQPVWCRCHSVSMVLWLTPQHECFHYSRRYEGRRGKSEKYTRDPRFKAALSEMWELMSQPPVTSAVLSSRHRVSALTGFGWGRNSPSFKATCYCAVNHLK